MLRGIYTAASGMAAEMTRTDTIANNLANASTAGYKKDVAITRDFAGMLLQRLNDGPSAVTIGELGVGAAVDEIATEHSPGGMRTTGNPLDLAIDGHGFFTVQTPNGIRYTRNGSFARSSGGELVTADGYQVLGQGGAIAISGDNGGKVHIASDGRIFVDDTETGRLRLSDFADPRRLVKEGASLFALGSAVETQNAAGSVMQGSLEQSNVNVVAEMVNMIAGYRAYEINSKAVQAQDDLLDKAVNEVGKV
jgi:flagellar basal-body rod protein FlgF